MSEDSYGSSAPIVSVRPGRNRLHEEDRVMLEERRRRLKKKKAEEEADQNRQFEGQGHGEIYDDISVFGIPKEEMTEHVRGALNLLLDQINHLRTELSKAKGHEAYLEEQVEKDRLLHVMQRRAFMARLGLALRRVEDEQAQFSFIYITLTHAQRVRTDLGPGAYESLLVHGADALRDRLVPGDIIGTLENAQFGIILPGTPLVEAHQKGQSLVAEMLTQSFIWQGQKIDLKAAFGVTKMAPGDQGEEVVSRARQECEA